MFQLASVSLTYFGGNAFHLEKIPGGGGVGGGGEEPPPKGSTVPGSDLYSGTRLYMLPGAAVTN